MTSTNVNKTKQAIIFFVLFK